MAALEGNLGMQPVALPILQRELARTGGAPLASRPPIVAPVASTHGDPLFRTARGGSARDLTATSAAAPSQAPPGVASLQSLRSLTNEVGSLEDKLHASEARVEELAALVAQLQTALVQKDEQLWCAHDASARHPPKPDPPRTAPLRVATAPVPPPPLLHHLLHRHHGHHTRHAHNLAHQPQHTAMNTSQGAGGRERENEAGQPAVARI